MISKRWWKTVASVLGATLVISASAVTQSKPWVSAYYPGWELGDGSNGYLPIAQVDFTAMTHVIHFSLQPRSDGSLDAASNTITTAGAHALTSAAHAVGTKVLISVGGWATEQAFLGATSTSVLPTFVSNLVAFMKANAYDGIDIDWEPISPSDYPKFESLIRALRTALGSGYLLTTTAGDGYGSAMAAIQTQVDQINIMTYDLSFPSPGWVTWYNSAVHQNGVTFASTGGPVPACDNIVAGLVAAGVPINKIGIGSEFGGFVWQGGVTPGGNGVTGPDQAWTTPPNVSSDVPLYASDGSGIMQKYFTPQRYHWDSGAQASYLSIDNSGSSNDYFISYEDTNDVNAKFSYIRQQGLGGMIIWSLGMGYPGNGTYPMLALIKRNLGGSATHSSDTTCPTVALASPSNGSTVSGVTTLTATAADNVGVVGVTFYIDGVQLGNPDVAAPYTASWSSTTAANGTHSVKAVAADAAGNTASVSVSVIVSNTAVTPDTVAPVLVAPAAGASNLVPPVTCVWNASSGTSRRYHVQIAADPGFASLVVDSSGIVPDTLVVAVLAQGKLFYWRVCATSGGISGSWSAARSFSTAATTSQMSMMIYQDSLAKPWINASWAATVDFRSTRYVYSGTKSISVVQGAWGALSLRYGNWNSTVTLDPNAYSALRFSVYCPAAGTFQVLLENTQGGTFSAVDIGSISRRRWTPITIPFSQLSPSGQKFDRIDILEISGVQKSYYIDSIAFLGSPNQAVAIPTGAPEANPTLPTVASLEQNYPNPFNPSTTLSYTLPEAGAVSLKVYDVLGDAIADLSPGVQPAGVHSVRWDARGVPSGVYVCRLQFNATTSAIKMILLK